jgi:hypothetical protein
MEVPGKLDIGIRVQTVVNFLFLRLLFMEKATVKKELSTRKDLNMAASRRIQYPYEN